MLTAIASAPIPLVVPGILARASPGREPRGEGPSPLIGAHVAADATRSGVLAAEATSCVLSDGDVVIKDQIDVAGMPAGGGLPDAGPVLERDATIVARIRAAGGRVIGKTKMTELGLDGTGVLMRYDMPRNPRAPAYAPG